MMHITIRLFFGALLFSQTAVAKTDEVNLEILNKGGDIWVKVVNGGAVVGENLTKVDAGVVKAGQKPQGKPHQFKGVDISKETILHIYMREPGSKGVPVRVYQFEPGKTIYVTWNPIEKIPLYPQTGPKVHIGQRKTASGLSLAKNVVVTPKESNITDITWQIQSEDKENANPAPRKSIDTIENPQDLDDLWKKWCNPYGAVEHPTSIFCAAGMGNSFALLVLRLRFVKPVVNGQFDASKHLLKIVGDELPPLPGLNLKSVYNELLGNKSQKNEAMQWTDFDEFLKFLTTSKDLAKYLNEAFLFPYGLSTEDLGSVEERKTQALKLTKDATKAMQGWVYSAPTFPSTNIYEDGKYLRPSDLFKKRCTGLGGGAWHGTLFCAIGEGNLSATYLAQISFVKPNIVFPTVPKPGETTQQAVHAVSWLLGSITRPAVNAAVGFQIGPVIKMLNDKDAKSITWEDLRNTLITRMKDFTESVPYWGNSYLERFGLEIAP